MGPVLRQMTRDPVLLKVFSSPSSEVGSKQLKKCNHIQLNKKSLLSALPRSAGVCRRAPACLPPSCFKRAPARHLLPGDNDCIFLVVTILFPTGFLV